MVGIFDPFTEVRILSGCDISKDIVVIDSDLKLPGQLSKGQKQEVETALGGLETEYEKYRETLSEKLKYGKFAKIIQKNLKKLDSITQDDRVLIVAKLVSLAYRRIETKENNFSGIYTFFHKCNQWLHGHGFQTKGQWGIELASKIVPLVQYPDLENEIEQFLFPSPKEHPKNLNAPVNFSEMNLLETINSLSKPRFIMLMYNVILKNEEPVAKKRMLDFFEALNNEKKGFIREDIAEGSLNTEEEVDYKNLIDENMIVAFLSRAEKLAESNKEEKP